MNLKFSYEERLDISSRLLSKHLTVLGFCLLVLCWGCFPVVTKLGVESILPLFFTCLRLSIAACIMSIVRRFFIRPRFRMTWRHHCQTASLGIFLIGIPSAVFAVAVCSAQACTVSVIWATMPLFAAF